MVYTANPKELLQPTGVSYDLARTISDINDFMSERLRTRQRRTPTPEELAGGQPVDFDLEEDFTPFTLSAEGAKKYGVDLAEGWQMQVAPDPGTATGVQTTLLSPDGWRVTETGDFLSPEGETFSEEEIEENLSFGESVERLFPQQTQEDVLSMAEQEPEAFFESIKEIGRNEDTEKLLKGFGFTDTQMAQLWGEMRPWHVLEEARWHIGDWAIPLWLQAGAQTTMRGFDIVQQYTWQPVEINMAYMDIRARAGLELTPFEKVFWQGRPSRGELTESDVRFLERMVEAEKKYGVWGAPFTNEAAEAWEEWNSMPSWAKLLLESMNPVFIAPLGPMAGMVAGPMRGVPYLGKVAQASAKAVQMTESGLALPVTGPIKVVGYGSKQVLRAVERFRPNMKYIRFDLPQAEALAKDIVNEDWAYRLADRLAKVPHAGKVVNTFIKGWDPALVARTVPARAMLVGHAVRSTGQQTRNIVVANLKAISDDPVKLFRFDANTVSHAPWLKAIKGSGATRTLDDIFTNPLKYRFSGKQGKLAKEYIIASHQILDDVVKLMEHHGITVPKRYFPEGSHWFRRHVIATNFGKEPLQTTGRARALGSNPSMFKHRTVDDTFEAIFEGGLQYVNNPEVLVGEVYEQAFNLLSQQYVQKLMMPKSVRRIALARRELKQIKKYIGMIDSELKGIRAKPEQAAAFKRQYPDLAASFEKARQMPTQAEKDVTEYLRRLSPEAKPPPTTARAEVPFMITRDMERRLGEMGFSTEAVSRMTPAEAWEKLGGVSAVPERPPRRILREGLEQMDRQQRLIVREGARERLVVAQREQAEIAQEIAGIEEYLKTDPVASYRGTMDVTTKAGLKKTREVSLTTVLTKEGDFPETLTKRQAQVLLMGREIKPNVLTPDGRVRWEYVLDELAEHFGMSEQQLIDRIRFLRTQKNQLKVLRSWTGDASEAVKSAQDMLKILDDIDSNAANIPPSMVEQPLEPVMPAAGEKPPWQMSRNEYGAYDATLPPHQRAYVGPDNEFGRALYGQEADLYLAVKAGEDVPADILRQYPEIQQLAFKEAGKRMKPPEGALPEVPTVEKEAWQMSWYEFHATKPTLTNKSHRELVQAALKEGKPVPRRVLVDYPELVSLEDSWWLTRDEWLQGQARLTVEAPLPPGGKPPVYDYHAWGEQHRAVVAKALEEGKAVCPEVLKDYPELQAMLPEAGAPEAGKQVDIFGNVYEVRPKGKGKVTQISMEEYNKLQAAYKEAGHIGEPPNVQRVVDRSALKEPWKLRRGDYAEAVDPAWDMADNPLDTAGGKAYHVTHPRSVEDALVRGDPVAPEVIADYVRYPLKDMPYLTKAARSIERMKGLPAKPKAEAVEEAAEVAEKEAATVEAQAPPAEQPPRPPETAWKSEFADVPEPRSAALREKKLRNIRSELARRQREASARMALRAGEARLPGPAAKWGAFPQEVVDELRAFYEPQGNAILQAMSTASGFMRMFKATMDFSAPSIQGTAILGYAFALLPTRPIAAMRLIKAWVKAVGLHIAVAAKPSMFVKWIAKPEVQRLLQQRCVAYGGSHATFEFYDVFGTLMRVAKKIPGGEALVRQTFGRAEASFNFFGEYIRNEFWKILGPAAIKQGRGRQLATLLDRLTGVMSTEAMGLPLWQRQLESGFLFFAPRYIRACLWVVGQVFRGGWTGRQALKALAGIVTMLPTFYWITCEALGQEPIWDPRSARFMTVEIAGRHIGPGSFWYGLVRLFADIYVFVAQDQDKPINFWSLHRSSETRDNPFLLFWYNRSAPLTGVFVDVAIEQTTYLGEPLESEEDYAMYALQQFTPIAFNEAFFHDLEWGGEAVSPAMLAGEIFGLRTYPISLREQFYKVAEQYIPKLEEAELHENQLEAWRKGTLKWGDLDTYQKSLLLMRYDDLREADEIATLEALKWRGEDYRAWYFEVTQTKTWMVDEGTRIGTKLLDGVISTRQFRDQVNDMNYAYGAMVNAARNNPRYESIYAQFDRDLGDAAETIDIAYDEYMETVVGGDFEDAYGDFDFDAYNAAIREFREKWGTDIYDQVITILESNKYDQDPIVVELWKDRRKLWDYWQVPEGDERIEYRISHPDIDAALLLWGYVSQPRSEEAYNIMVNRAKELGIPLSAIAAGEYEEVEAAGVATEWFRYLATSEEGHARERFRAENPAFDAWGRDFYGWEPIDREEIPTEDVEKLLVKYEDADSDQRLKMRCENEELDAWLVDMEGEEPLYGTEACAAI